MKNKEKYRYFYTDEDPWHIRHPVAYFLLASVIGPFIGGMIFTHFWFQIMR